MERYVFLSSIDPRSYGGVYLYKDSVTGAPVVIKQIPLRYPFDREEQTRSVSDIHEISILQELDHPRIVRLLDVLYDEIIVNLVFEYVHCDLATFIRTRPETFDDPEVIKSFLYQILEGVAYCHYHNILHRDLKPRNLLVDVETKTVKLADFGSARKSYFPIYSGKVATLAYRAPEIILDMEHSKPMDMWSVGCIFAEMVRKDALFVGLSEMTILMQIFSILGVPNESTWPGINARRPNMPMDPSQIRSRRLNEVVPNLDSAGFDLFRKLLCLDPRRRLTAEAALRHPYFRGVRLPR